MREASMVPGRIVYTDTTASFRTSGSPFKIAFIFFFFFFDFNSQIRFLLFLGFTRRSRSRSRGVFALLQTFAPPLLLTGWAGLAWPGPSFWMSVWPFRWVWAYKIMSGGGGEEEQGCLVFREL
ncbi:hypothetical protein L484_024815 [Morus notabilis]|uniref:Uncharacterized protein n=1 Tax=Morus notabilis TaxID=981085 RepID=W9R705_9ROSA|nr:hypothetical protein L484_024815 [Morus notabilis]